MKRLLTIGHSYVVGLNRALAHEMAIAGAGEWSVTVAAPSRYRGDLRQLSLEPQSSEHARVVPIETRLASMPHLMWYGGSFRALMREGWDVVHCWEEPYVLAAAQIADACPRPAKFVFASFQNIAKRYPFPLSYFENRVLDRANGWIAFGRTTHEVQRERDARYGDSPSAIIGPGVDAGVFRPHPTLRGEARSRLGWNDDIPVIGFSGRFIREKGIDTMIAALQKISHPWRALFVGAGPERKRIEKLAARAPDHVRIVADARHDDMPAWMNAMDVLCAPSRTTAGWREQFGRMLIEAMACGVPVIGSTSGEIPHVLADAGIVAREGDVEDWRDAIDRVLGTPGIRRELSERGVRRVHEHFTWQHAALNHLRFFSVLT
jgi:glycosyltransferase involved in cell wall biosynthesis